MSVSALVYVAARAPDAGEEFGALAAKFPKAPASDGVVRANGFFWLSEEAFLREFARDLEPGRARTLYAVQGRGPESARAAGSRRGGSGREVERDLQGAGCVSGR